MIKELYNQQEVNWPKSGKHILAQFDDDTIIVYQAYRSSIGHFAASNQYFGGGFSYTRMSWIKPNFLWMMYRSGWGTKPGQEVTLAIRIKRLFFDRILALAVASSFRQSTNFDTEEEWKKALRSSDVRLQWDPDHDPTGDKVERKAIQLGLRNDVIKEYGREAIVEILDISDFVSEQRIFAKEDFANLIIPKEEVYTPNDEDTCYNIGLDRKVNQVVQTR